MAETDASATDISFLLGWARSPERWREFLDPAHPAEPAEPAANELSAEGGIGLALVGRAGALVALNSAARLVCEQRLGLIESRGELFLSPSNHEALTQARRALSQGGGQLIVKLTARENDSPQFAYACAAEGLPAHLGVGLPKPQDGWIALVFPAQEAAALLAASLRSSFGLTPAETRLATLLREGLSLGEAADELAVSINTVRNQLRSIFDKMGLRRQADLVRALSQLSALAGLLPSNAGRTSVFAAGSALRTAPVVSHFDLPDGRKLAWRDYGAPDGSPVLIVHQGLGGSLYPRGTDALARDLGLRLIVPARPGVGTSDPRPRYSYEGVAADMVALVDGLGVDRLQIGCVLDGAPYALAAAKQLQERLSRLIMVNPRPPGWRTSVNRDLAHPLLQFRRKLARNPWLADVIYPMLRMRLTPKGIERFVTAGATTPADAAYLASHPDLLAYSIEYVTDGFVPSARGMIDSTKCAARSGPMEGAGIVAPLTVWLGAEDPMLSEEEVRAWLGDRLESLRLFPNAGNFLAYQAWPEMLAWLAEGERRQ